MSKALPYDDFPPPSMEELALWLEKNRVTYHEHVNLEPMENAHNWSWRIVSSGSIDVGEIVASIPKTSILSVRTASLQGLAERYPIETTPSVLPLAIAVLHEMRRGKMSKFYGYLQSLPRTLLPLPLFWDVEELGFGEDGRLGLQWLISTEAIRELGSKNESSQSISAIRQFFHEARDLFTPSSNGSEPPTLAAFLHAYSLCTSRAFQTDIWHRPALLPFADLFNHSSVPHVHLESDDFVCPKCGSLAFCPAHDGIDPPTRLVALDPHTRAELAEQRDDCILVVNRPITTGEEVKNTYGEIGIGQTLVEYAFVDEENEEGLNWGWREMLIDEEDVLAVKGWRDVLAKRGVRGVEDLEGLVFDPMSSDEACEDWDGDGFGISSTGQLSRPALACVALASSPEGSVDAFEHTVAVLENVWASIERHDDEHFESQDKAAAELAQAVCVFLRQRLAALHCADQPLDRLFSLRDELEARKGTELQVLGLTACLLERNLLETTLSRWEVVLDALR